MKTAGHTAKAALSIGFLLLLLPRPAQATHFLVQCPGDVNGDAIIDVPDPAHPKAKCMHLAAGDGFVSMADGRRLYMFGFSNVTGAMPEMVMHHGMLAGSFPAPQIAVDEGDEFYLTLSNVGMALRPDLFDPHTVHWHGFPNASAIFDGMPDGGIAINMMASLTYYYNVLEPGTYLYHCHVEATEHMQMGMLGSLYVRPKQNGTPFQHNGKTYTKFAYNDGDGSTGYDVDYVVQISSFDSEFHDASESVQPLPFALMKDNYPMLNGRGYPDTVNSNTLPAPSDPDMTLKQSQFETSLLEVTAGQRVLLRLSNVSVTRFYTVSTPGIKMKVVGQNARLLRGPSPDGGATPGKNLYYDTSSVTLGGGESMDIILDTAGLAAGTYFLYTTNLNHLSNNQEDFGGMMTEIRIGL